VVRHALSPCASVRQFKLGAMPCARASVGDINASERAPAIFRVFMRPLSSLAEPSAFRRPHAATWDATRQLEVFSRRREAVLKIKTVSCLPMACLEDVDRRFRWCLSSARHPREGNVALALAMSPTLGCPGSFLLPGAFFFLVAWSSSSRQRRPTRLSVGYEECGRGARSRNLC